MGETLLDVAGVKALAALPSLDELRGDARSGLIQAPATKIARTVAEPGAQLARVFGAYAARQPSFSLISRTHDNQGRSPRKEY